MLRRQPFQKHQYNLINILNQLILIIQLGLAQINQEEYGQPHQIPQMWRNILHLVNFRLTHIRHPIGEYLKVVVDIDRLYLLCDEGDHDGLHEFDVEEHDFVFGY